MSASKPLIGTSQPPSAPASEPGFGMGQPPSAPASELGSGTGQQPSVSASEPGSGTGQPPSWEELKAKILAAIKKDEQAEVFEALLADVSNFMTELKRTG